MSENITKNIEELSQMRKRMSKFQACIAIQHDHIVGLRSDGTVLVTGRGRGNHHDKKGFPAWRNIVAIATTRHEIVGLRSDGVVFISDLYGMPSQSDTLSIGSAVLRDYDRYRKSQSQSDTFSTVGAVATGVVAIDAAMSDIGILKSNGTVIVVSGTNYDYGKATISEWRDIVAIYS